jgi:hypothetical protein
MVDRAAKKPASRQPAGVVKEQPTGLVDPVTLGLTAKGIYEAGKAGVDLSVRLYELTKGEVALVCAVTESATFDDRFRLRLTLSSLCPHGIAINKVAMATLKDVPLQVFLLRGSSRGFGWDTRSPAAVLAPEIPGRAAILVQTAFVIPPMRTQEAVIELERAPVLQRIHNKRGATISINYNILGDDGDARDLRMKLLLRDDRPLMAGFFTPEP